MSDELKKMLEGVVGVVEATNYEHLCLWRTHHQELGEQWEAANWAIGVTVGKIGKMPICVSMKTDVVRGVKVLFIEPTSQVVDWRKIEDWLKQNLPSSAFKDAEYVNKVDAMNFSNVFTKYAPVTKIEPDQVQPSFVELKPWRQAWLSVELLNKSPTATLSMVDGVQYAQLEHPLGGPLGCVRNRTGRIAKGVSRHGGKWCWDF